MNIRGCLTATITPFFNNTIDETSLIKFLKFQLENGVSGVVPCGTTGESASLTDEEYRILIKHTVDTCKGKIPVIPGISTNCLRRAIELSTICEQSGADLVMIVTPFYLKPSQEGLYRYFKTFHDNSSLPFIIYNIPHRSCCDLYPETFARMNDLPRLVGVKDATSDLVRPIKIAGCMKREFLQFSGDDFTSVPFIAQGGAGTISVISNFAPRLTADLHEAWFKRDFDKLHELNVIAQKLSSIAFIEPNPSTQKYILHRMGIIASPEVRLPLIELSEESKRTVDAVLKETKLL